MIPQQVIWPFGSNVEIRLFGRPRNWNIGCQSTDSEVYQRIAEVARKTRIVQLLAPKPSFNGALARPEDLTVNTPLSNRDYYVRIPIRRGVNADCIEVPVASGYWFSSTDCIALVVMNPVNGTVFAAHAAENSLIDRGRMEARPQRKHQSVVDALVASFPKSDQRSLMVAILGPLGARYSFHPWNDPEKGIKNRWLIDYVVKQWGNGCVPGMSEKGKLDLTELAKAQLIKAGIPEENIQVQVFPGLGPDDEPLWWSAQAGNTERNGVLIIRQL